MFDSLFYKKIKSKKITTIFLLFTVIFLITYTYVSFFYTGDEKNECKISVVNLTDEKLTVEFFCEDLTKSNLNELYFGEILDPFESSVYFYSYDKDINVNKFIVRVTNRTYDISGDPNNEDSALRYNGANYLNFSDNEFKKIQIVITYANSTVNITGQPKSYHSIGNSGLNPMDIFIIKTYRDTNEPRYIRKI